VDLTLFSQGAIVEGSPVEGCLSNIGIEIVRCRLPRGGNRFKSLMHGGTPM